jgi:hypothetical protein
VGKKTPCPQKNFDVWAVCVNPKPPQAKRGRPRSTELDKLQRELGVTRRHARRVLKSNGADEAILSPVGKARLEKIRREIEFLEIKISSAKLEARALAGELCFRDEVETIVGAPMQAVKNALQNFAKAIAPRLVNQPQKAIEKTLADEADRLTALAETALAAVQTKGKL